MRRRPTCGASFLFRALMYDHIRYPTPDQRGRIHPFAKANYGKDNTQDVFAPILTLYKNEETLH